MGSMRRGPKLFYQPMRLSTTSGNNAAPVDPQVKAHNNTTPGDSDALLDTRAPVKPQSNVIDYFNSSMWSFLFLSYASCLFSSPSHDLIPYRYLDWQSVRRRSRSSSILIYYSQRSIPASLEAVKRCGRAKRRGGLGSRSRLDIQDTERESPWGAWSKHFGMIKGGRSSSVSLSICDGN